MQSNQDDASDNKKNRPHAATECLPTLLVREGRHKRPDNPKGDIRQRPGSQAQRSQLPKRQSLGFCLSLAFFGHRSRPQRKMITPEIVAAAECCWQGNDDPWQGVNRREPPDTCPPILEPAQRP